MRAQALIPLSREHHTALVLALRIEREVPEGAAEVVGAVYADLIGFWARGMLPHFRAEQECLLARLVRHVPPDDTLVERTQRDHLRIEAMVTAMRDDPSLEARRETLLRFAAALRAHIRWEEHTLFDAIEGHLTAHEMDALAADIAERVGDGNEGARDVWPEVMNQGRPPG